MCHPARTDLHPHTGERRNYTVAMYLPYLFQVRFGSFLCCCVHFSAPHCLAAMYLPCL